MASKMEEILEQLQQINEDLNNSVKEKNVKWRMVGGKRVKQGTPDIDQNALNDSKDFIEDIIKNDINGGAIKKEEDLTAIKEKIDEVMKTLNNLSANKKNLMTKAQVDALIKPILDSVKPVQESLTKKHEAINEYKTKGYDVNEHVAYEQAKLAKLEKIGKRDEAFLDSVYDSEAIFDDEFEDYKLVSEKENCLNEIKGLYVEFEKLENDLKTAPDDKKEEISAKIAEKVDEIGKKERYYSNNYDKDAKFPANRDEMKKNGLKNVTDMAKDVADKKKEVSDKFDDKLSKLSPDDQKKLTDFCNTFGVKTDDVLKGDIGTVYKILNGKEKEVFNRKMLNEKRKQAVQNTIDGLGKLEKTKTNYENIQKAKDEDILSNDVAKNKINEMVEQKLTSANLINPDQLKRKDLRKALKTSVYKGKRFAGIRSFIGSISKKRAMNKITNNYRNTSSKEYLKNVKENLKNQYQYEQTRREHFRDKYAAKGIEQAINNNTPDKTDIFEELDKDER